jgi:hypothetical protein
MAKLASLIPSVGSALGIFVVNNITVPYIEPFPKTVKRIHMRIWLLALFL